MRALLIATMPNQTANALSREGTLGKTLSRLIEALRPEHAYFGEVDGKRAGFFVVQIEGAHRIPAVAEPLFLALDASVRITPVMTPEDLQKAAPDMDQAAKVFGRR